MRRKVAVALGLLLFAASSGAFAGSPVTDADQAGNPPLLNSRLDQLARPPGPPTDNRPPTLDSPGAPAPGSFPRSFLIPGTDTSVSISGFFDATGTTRAGR